MSSGFLFDVRYSIRSFTRTPAVTLALLVTIALGIGSNASVYAFARGLIHAPREDLVSIFDGAYRNAGPLSPRQYASLARQRGIFKWVSAARITTAHVVVSGPTEIMSVAAINPDVAAALNLSPRHGVTVSRRLFQDEKRIRIDGVDLPVTGVAPASLNGLYRERAIDLWVNSPAKKFTGESRTLWPIARLNPSVTVAQAGEAVRRSGGADAGLEVLPYTGMMPETAAGMARLSVLFDIAAAVILLITCANVASFLIGRALGRSRETSLRVALGVCRLRLIRQLLADSVVVSIAGGVCGLLLAYWAAHVVPAFLFEKDAENLLFAPSLSTTLRASAACAGVIVFFGLAPVFVTNVRHPASALQRESAGPSRRVKGVRIAFVTAQMASCCLLLILTAFLSSGLRATVETNTKHSNSESILVTAEAPPFTERKSFERVEAAARAIGVVPKAWTARAIGGEPVWQLFRLDLVASTRRAITLGKMPFTGESLKHFVLPPIAGNLFGFEGGSCPEAVVNEEAATQLFGRNTVGRNVVDPNGLPVQIIGVVRERATTSAHRLATIYYQGDHRPSGILSRPEPMRFTAAVASEVLTTELDTNVVSPSYFEVMRAAWIAGRGFGNDRIAGECRSAVINEEASESYFGGKALGAAVIDDRGRRSTIVGVVRLVPPGTFQRRTEPSIFFPMAQDCPRRMTLLGTIGHAGGARLEAVKRQLDSLPGSDLSHITVETLADQLARTALAPWRIALVVLASLAAIAILLSMLGLSGTLGDAARYRRRDLAIRMALGAQRSHVVFQILREGLGIAMAGVGAGTMGALLLSRWLEKLMPGPSSPPWPTWFAAPLFLTITVLLASLPTACRALLGKRLVITRDDY